MEITTALPTQTAPGPVGALLKRSGLACTPNGQYLQVGVIDRVCGWILHLSASKFELLRLLDIVLPTLIRDQVSFRVALNPDIADLLNSGQLGYIQVGKLIKLYPGDEEAARRLAEKLIPLTAPFKGPAVPTDIHLGGQVYARHGGYNLINLINGQGDSQPHYLHPEAGYIWEEYPIPFRLPKNISWPFGSLANPDAPPVSSLLHGRYRVVETLKEDAKGRVIKALRLRKPFFVSWCLIKEGRRNTCMDDQGRDISHRLAWQRELQKDLAGKIPVPAILDFFEERGDTYLVMEFVQGVPLEDFLAATYINKGWKDLEPARKQRLLTCLLNLIGILERLHEAGYVHRDITPVNFILGKTGLLHPIDMELAYDTRRAPYPPLQVGTVGYMSPEQQAGATPTVKEDIYGLGALMINFFTNLMRRKLETGDPELLHRQLFFHTGSPAIVSLIHACLSPKPADRPSLPVIRTLIKDKLELLSRLPSDWPASHEPESRHIPLKSHLTETVVEAINTLAGPLMTSPEGIWFSGTLKKEGDIVNEQKIRAIRIGLGEGIAGVMLTLAHARKAGLLPDALLAAYRANLGYLENQFLKYLPDVPRGLYEGAAGVALALAGGIRSGLIREGEDRIRQIFHCLMAVPEFFDISMGSAGILLGILGCPEFLGPAGSGLAQPHIEALVRSQLPDGTWAIKNQPATTAHKLPGWSNGIAGITTALALCTQQFRVEGAERAARRGLNGLVRRATARGEEVSWRDPVSRGPLRPWFHEGYAGIVLALLTGYKIFGDTSYRRVAEEALRNFPPRLTVQQLSLNQGLTGIGEVYLEAHRILGGDEWLQRAGWLANLLLNSHRFSREDGLYWLTDTSNWPTAGLGSGCSGVIHFLIRYLHPDQINFPMLPE